MELALESDTYTPNMDVNNNYVDSCPPESKFRNGMRCPCGSRQNFVFDKRVNFQAHLKSKAHAKWLAELNANKMNYYVECEKLKELANSQRKIIANLEKEKAEYTAIIVGLNKQAMIKGGELDLMSFD